MTDSWSPVDPLGEALHFLRMSGIFYCRSEFTAPWAADILVIQAIRSWIAQDQAAQTGWLGALRDKQVGRAIALVHREPARNWTVAALATTVGMSRSAFSARFTELVGEPAMHYAARWKMHAALMWLDEDDAPLRELASRLGYESEAAFSRAFKRFIGVSPGTVRRRGRLSARDWANKTET